MSLKSELRKIWRKSHYIRSLYWRIYVLPPFKVPRDFMKQKIKDHMLDVTLPSVYEKCKSKPINEKKVIFISYRGAVNVLNDSFRLLYDRLEQSGQYEIKVHYMKHSFAKRKEYIKRAGIMLEDIADAKYVFLDEANEVISCIDKRPETYVVEMWHACGAFKKFGMSTGEKIFGAEKKDLLRHPNYKNLNLVTVSAPEVKWAYVEAMNLNDQPEIVEATGVSRTDVYFDPAYIEAAKERVYNAFPAARDKKIILYAPTYRGRVKAATASDKLDLRAFAKALGDEYVLITKHHPFVKDLPVIPKELRGTYVFDASGKLTVEDLLTVSDICISDYSSVVFEYALFERPMLFFAYDLENYDDWRGFYYPYEEMTPGPICRTNEELIDYIIHIDDRYDRDEVRAFREKFMSACDGHATDRIIEKVFGRDL